MNWFNIRRDRREHEQAAGEFSGTDLQAHSPPSRERLIQGGSHFSIGLWHLLPEPSIFFNGRGFIRTRWHVNLSASLGTESNSELIGSNLAATWSSVGFFGPLTVRPDWWDRGVGKRLRVVTLAVFHGWPRGYSLGAPWPL